ncbi:biopolymer transporter ExbD [Thiomicrospira microaerophila]|uniref:biopolymer transporter ExbD n=1 Tax=Thiomicrospira microaerophila TaxID=406020 RepID=UPI00200F9F7E|nr:biopolymer transporter ExbD [Thiomicrospira microaerophila]UQB42961.1 biopolymer transporter ExbD [Thiomicrospira microaerophila]
MKRFDSMNVIPLIDVMLVLLAIVLLTASFIVHDKIDIQLPQTENTASFNPEDREKLNLSLDNSGQLYWDGEPIQTDGLNQKMAQLDRNTLIQLRVDQAVEFHFFVTLMDIVKKYQHDNITILTERKS